MDRNRGVIYWAPRHLNQVPQRTEAQGEREGKGAQGILSFSFLVTPNWIAWDGWDWGRRLSFNYASLCK